MVAHGLEEARLPGLKIKHHLDGAVLILYILRCPPCESKTRRRRFSQGSFHGLPQRRKAENAALEACKVADTSPSLWEVETNAASNCEGGK